MRGGWLCAAAGDSIWQSGEKLATAKTWQTDKQEKRGKQKQLARVRCFIASAAVAGKQVKFDFLIIKIGNAEKLVVWQ